MPSHYLNQCLIIVKWTLRNKLPWNLNQNSTILIQENTFENVVCEMAAIFFRGRWVKMSFGGISYITIGPRYVDYFHEWFICYIWNKIRLSFSAKLGICFIFHAPISHYINVLMSSMASQITNLTIVCSKVYSGADQRKHQSSASLAFVRGIHQSRHKGPVTQKIFPFDDVIMVLWVVKNRLPPCWLGSIIYHVLIRKNPTSLSYTNYFNWINWNQLNTLAPEQNGHH